MLLIDQKGQRVRKVCDKCHKPAGRELCAACTRKRRRQEKRKIENRWFMIAIANAKRAVGQ